MNETKILDLYEAAALHTVGIKLARMDQARNGAHKVFVFNDEPTRIEEGIERYRRNELSVDASTYARSIKEIKKRIHDMNDLAEA